MVEQLQPRYAIQWIDNIATVPQAQWDALAQPLKTPFFEWSWLHNMETSGSVGAKTGWLPCHLVIWRDQTAVAIAPLFLKGHSRGEFVFDNEWADVAYQMGIEYYPKLLGMSPFTPAEGYRFLIAADEDEDDMTELMVKAIDQFCLQHKISGCNLLYVDPEWRSRLEHLGYKTWLHHSYIWSNQNYQTFEDYLGSFNANQRRNIKRERKAVEASGLRLEVLTGDQLTRSLLSQVYDFYCDTCDKFGWWGSKYLQRQFFEQLYPDFVHQVVVFAVYENTTSHAADLIGMSFCINKGNQLYGRYWGASQEFDKLHFEACYYSPIEWAIANGIKIFDPGAGGRHKKRRGFPATANYSLHRFYDPRFSQVWDNYIGRINAMEQREIDGINEDLPFKSEASDTALRT